MDVAVNKHGLPITHSSATVHLNSFHKKLCSAITCACKKVKSKNIWAKIREGRKADKVPELFMSVEYSCKMTVHKDGITVLH